jgi:uncharacterized membrane protein
MPEDKTDSIPATNFERPSEAPTPEDMLTDKLAEQADTVTSQLRDLLPESPAVESVQEPAVAAAPGLRAAQPVTASTEPATLAGGTGDESLMLDEPADTADVLPEPIAELTSSTPAEAGAAALPAATQPGPASEVPRSVADLKIESNSDDRLMSALAWLTMVLLQLPIVSVIQLLSATTKDRSFQRHHAVTSLLFYVAAIVYEFVAAIVYTVLGAVTLGCGYACLWVIFFLPHVIGLYYALQAYNGKTLELPVLSNFGRQQGWL